MEYDQEFEKFWYYSESLFKATKESVYSIWQAAKAPEPEKKEIELEGGRFAFLSDSDVVDYVTTGRYRIFGRERKTEADAKKAAELMRKRDRLAAFVYENCGYEYEFIDGSDDNFFIYFDNGQSIYVPASEDKDHDLCKQYMPRYTAIWLCEKLNSGEIVL